MMKTMSLEKARQLKAFYQSVAGTVNKAFADSNQQIEDIVVSPADTLNQWYFFNFYMECRNNEEALQFYTYKEYCVIAIVRELQDNKEVLYSYRPLEDIPIVIS